jgi:guanylate kinase
MKLIILTAPSGAGKTTIARRVIDEIADLSFSVSATTRPRREGEVDGEDYYFLSEEEFQERVERGDFLEFEEVYPGRYYGTLREELAEQAREHPVMLDIDVKGAENVKKAFDDQALAIFIEPPSLQELAERLRGRQTETEDDFARRIERARMELQYADRFDVRVLNDELEQAVQETLAHIRAFIEN